MTRLTLLCVLIPLGVIAPFQAVPAYAQQPVAGDDRPSAAAGLEDDDQSTSVWMEKKLQHSQALLRGLATADFDDVRYNAQRLKLLNRVEGFVRRRNPEYRAHLLNFSRVVSEIERQAEKENLEGATLAFNQLTVSCMECHKSLRSDAETETVTSDR